MGKPRKPSKAHKSSGRGNGLRLSTEASNCDVNPNPTHLCSVDLPSPALRQTFDSLAMQDLASAACVCRSWSKEAADDRRWEWFWKQELGRSAPLSRWNCAPGGYREQLRASFALHSGLCTRREYAISRHDGPVKVLLMMDGSPRRFVTIQGAPQPYQAVRLAGDVVKVWDEAALAKQRPLLVVYDTLKWLQLQNGKLFCWRIQDNAAIPAVDLGPGIGIKRCPWTEHPDVVASLIDPATASLVDVPLDSHMGCGTQSFEWLQLPGGFLASLQHIAAQRAIRCRVFSLATGRCLVESTLAGISEGMLSGGDHEALISCRTLEPRDRTIFTCAAYDTLVFSWPLQDSWLTESQDAAGEQAPTLSIPGVWQASSTAAGQGALPAIMDPIDQFYSVGPGPSDAPSQGLRRICSTHLSEPIRDIAVSYPAGQLILVCMRNLFIYTMDGVPQAFLSMGGWGSMHPPLPVEAGRSFVRPLPYSSRVAMHLDTTNALHVLDLEPHRQQPPPSPTLPPGIQLPSTQMPFWPPVTTHHTVHMVSARTAFITQYRLQTHTLRYPPVFPAGRPPILSTDPIIVEHSQCGGVIMTAGHPATPRCRQLLGLCGGPADITDAPQHGSKSSRAARCRNTPLCAALILIDSASGQYIRAVPMSGIIEATHSAGGCVAVAAGSRPSDHVAYREGRIVVLDFVEGLQRHRAARDRERRELDHAAASAILLLGSAAEHLAQRGERTPPAKRARR